MGAHIISPLTAFCRPSASSIDVVAYGKENASPALFVLGQHWKIWSLHVFLILIMFEKCLSVHYKLTITNCRSVGLWNGIPSRLVATMNNQIAIFFWNSASSSQVMAICPLF